MTLPDRFQRHLPPSSGLERCRYSLGSVLLLLPILAVSGPPQTVELPMLTPDSPQCQPYFPATPTAPERSPPPHVKPDPFHINLQKRFEEALLSRPDPVQKALERQLLGLPAH